MSLPVAVSRAWHDVQTVDDKLSCDARPTSPYTRVCLDLISYVDRDNRAHTCDRFAEIF